MFHLYMANQNLPQGTWTVITWYMDFADCEELGFFC